MNREEYLHLMESRQGDLFKSVGKVFGKEKKAANAVHKLENPGKSNKAFRRGQKRPKAKKKALKDVGSGLKQRVGKGVERGKEELPKLPGKVASDTGGAVAKHVIGDNWKKKLAIGGGAVGIGGALYKGRHHIAGLFRRKVAAAPALSRMGKLTHHLRQADKHIERHGGKYFAGALGAELAYKMYKKHKNRNK